MLIIFLGVGMLVYPFIENNMEDLFVKYKDELKDGLRYMVLRAELLDNRSLYNGRLGMMIIFFEYSRYKGDSLFERFAEEMLDAYELPDTLSWRFDDGMAGIGWGIVYLLSRKFIEGDVNDILFDLDKKMLEDAGVKYEDRKGVWTYLAYRRRYAIENRIVFPLVSVWNHWRKENISLDEESRVLNTIWNSCSK